MRTRLLLVAVAVAVAASAAGGVADAGTHAPRAAVTARSSTYGRILFDGRGFVVYAFTRDPRGRSVCRGACATAWPPYLVKGRPRAGAGVKSSRLGTTKRADGKLQVTYWGRPLYYYIGDRKPGQILCQNVEEFGGLWLVVGANGELVR